MRRIRSRLTYANVISTLALFLVLAGGSAVALNGSNTVFSDDIVNGQVKTQDLSTPSGAGAVFARNTNGLSGGGTPGTPAFAAVGGAGNVSFREGDVSVPSPHA